MTMPTTDPMICHGPDACVTGNDDMRTGHVDAWLWFTKLERVAEGRLALAEVLP